MAQTLIGPNLTEVADRPHGRETGFWEVTNSSAGQMTGNPEVVRDWPYKLSQRQNIGRTHKFSGKGRRLLLAALESYFMKRVSRS